MRLVCYCHCNCIPYCSYVLSEVVRAARSTRGGPSGPQHVRRSERSEWPAIVSTIRTINTYSYTVPYHTILISLCSPTHTTSAPCIHTCIMYNMYIYR
jgi:hypothetical protein